MPAHGKHHTKKVGQMSRSCHDGITERGGIRRVNTPFPQVTADGAALCDRSRNRRSASALGLLKPDAFAGVRTGAGNAVNLRKGRIAWDSLRRGVALAGHTGLAGRFHDVAGWALSDQG